MGWFPKIESYNQGKKVNIAGYEFSVIAGKATEYGGPVKLVDDLKAILVHKALGKSFVYDSKHRHIQQHELLDFIHENSNNLEVVECTVGGFKMIGYPNASREDVIAETRTIVEKVVAKEQGV